MSRFEAVRRVRELVENRRVAELAAAERAAAHAIEARDRARAARSGVVPATGLLRPGELAADRAAILALRDRIDAADQDVAATRSTVETARGRRVEAAVQRRSVERVDERRRAVAAREAARRSERQLDDLAIIRWQRS